MKSSAAYYLILLYITVLVKPLFPIVTDWYEHEFNPIQHEIQVHMVYGNHHLDKDLAESSSEDDHNKNHNSVKTENQASFHILLEAYKCHNPSAIINKEFKVCNFSKFSSVFISREGPPPKLI